MLIGIADTCTGEDVNVSQNYTNAVLRAGHVAVVLPRTEALGDNAGQAAVIRHFLSNIDGLLLPGGGADVDPKLYGEAAIPQMGEVNAMRDRFEYALLREAVAQRKPVFGICRGMQVINTFFGGTLWQDLPSQRPQGLLEHQRPDKKWEGVHPIEIDPTSRLYSLLGCDQCLVNSTHHQAVKEVAPGFRVSAQSPDGVIEAIESDQWPIFAVQFHPERLAWGDDQMFTNLFRNIFL